MKAKVILIGLLMGAIGTTTAFGASFPDVPSDHWAYQEVMKASEIGFISGMDDGTFGLGQTVTRAQFVSMMCRMFGWESDNATAGSFADNVDSGQWYFQSVETAVTHGAIDTDTQYFRPNEAITRAEMAVMLIKGLGYDNLVETAAQTASPFSDVTEEKGYINLAYDFGIVSGTGNGQFLPDGTATREEAAAMMLRCYEKRNGDTEFVHGFYAFSSYDQKALADKMDAVSFGWSKMEYRNGEGVVVNTLSGNGNEWVVPDGYENIVNELQQNGVKTHLNVFLSDRSTAETILNSAENRTAAVNAIMEEVTVDYRQLGRNPYEGVTIDFESLSGSTLRNSFTAFLQELDTALTAEGKSLYVAVHPVTADGAYYDGYDYSAIGALADKVILMAYDYEAKSISAEVQQSGFTTTPVTPFDQVYYGLHVISNSIADRDKIVLGLSPSANVEWDLQNGVILNSRGIDNTYETIQSYLQNGAAAAYSETYRNPYLTIQDGEVTKVIWYEDSRSIGDKIDLAQMFGIQGVSFWRLGLIPDDNRTAYSNIWGTVS